MRHYLSLILFLATAAVAEPLPDPDNGALTGIFHFPDSTEGGRFVAPGSHSVSIDAITSSHATEGIIGNESLSLDGETTRLELGFRYALSERIELGIDVPYVWHSSGALDALIDGWHETFGLPEGPSRRAQAQDQLRFRYQDPLGERISIDRSSHGIGDTRLIAGWRLSHRTNGSTAMRFGVTLPTGNTADLHGSGGVNVSVGIAGDRHELFGLEKLNGFYRLNAIHIGEPDLLADRYNEFIGQVAMGVGYQLTRGVELAVQGMARSATYDSEFDILGETSATVTFGGNIRLSDDYLLTLAVAEDIKVRSAPDVSFQIGFRYQPEPAGR